MPTMTYDYIFAGFGLSGMSLLVEMSRYPDFSKKKVLVVDVDDKKKDDRTWSFWSKEMYGLEAVVKKSWNKGYVLNRAGERIDLGLKSYQYHTLNGIDYYNYVRNQLQAFTNIEYVKEEINTAHPNGNVQTSTNHYEGGNVFVSYFKREDVKPQANTVFLWQHFKGWLIKAQPGTFQPNEFLMMDYRTSSQDRTNFFYVLPFDDATALIEFTEFSNDFYSQEAYDGKLKNYIQDILGIVDYEVQETEFNAIPMTDYLMENPVQGKLIHIGTLAGYIKASSGYAFTRTLEKNRRLAKLVMENKVIKKSLLQSSAKYVKFDRTMLDVMANRDVQGAEIFPALFQALGGEAMLDFLDERSTLWQELQVMMAVPERWKFVKSFMSR